MSIPPTHLVPLNFPPVYVNCPEPSSHFLYPTVPLQSATFQPGQPYLLQQLPAPPVVLNPVAPCEPPAAAGHARRTSLNPDPTRPHKSKHCFHLLREAKRCTYCKTCGIFLPKTNALVYREDVFSGKLDANPEAFYKFLRKLDLPDKFAWKPSHLQFRQVAVGWLQDMADYFKYSCVTLHRAVAFLDLVASTIEILPSKADVVCVLCLYVSAKANETELKVPGLSVWAHLAKLSLPLPSLRKAELLILEILQWHLQPSTIHQYLTYYLARGVVFAGDTSHLQPLDHTLPRFIRKYCELFSDMVLQDFGVNKMTKEIVSCGIVAAARKCAGVYPFWSDEIAELTEMKWHTVQPIYQWLMSMFTNAHPKLAESVNAICYVEPVKEPELFLPQQNRNPCGKEDSQLDCYEEDSTNMSMAIENN